MNHLPYTCIADLGTYRGGRLTGIRRLAYKVRCAGRISRNGVPAPKWFAILTFPLRSGLKSGHWQMRQPIEPQGIQINGLMLPSFRTLRAPSRQCSRADRPTLLRHRSELCHLRSKALAMSVVVPRGNCFGFPAGGVGCVLVGLIPQRLPGSRRA